MPTTHSSPLAPPLDTLPSLPPSTAPPAVPPADGDARGETSQAADRSTGDAESAKSAVHGGAFPDRRPSSATAVSPVDGKTNPGDEDEQEPAAPAERFENGLVDQTSYMCVPSPCRRRRTEQELTLGPRRPVKVRPLLARRQQFSAPC